MAEAASVSMDFTTKILIVAVIVLAAGLYYLYTIMQNFKNGIVKIVQNLKNSTPMPSEDEDIHEIEGENNEEKE